LVHLRSVVVSGIISFTSSVIWQMPLIRSGAASISVSIDKERQFIKGQRYLLLSHKFNLDIEGLRALRLLLKANKRLHKTYLLKESFGQLWDYNNPSWARKFFENWKSQLRWQRLLPFEKFAEMVERHWNGTISNCRPYHRVSLGFMEGLNNKIRVLQRRAYGIEDQEYLMLKVVTSFIKEKKSV
jgi:transposase